jgi:hypothetical protein
MRDIKFVLYPEQNLPAQDRELLAYEIRAHVARHTHSVKQQRQYERSGRRRPQGTHDQSDGDGPISLVAPPRVAEGSDSADSDVLTTQAHPARTLPAHHGILIPKSAPGRPSYEFRTQRLTPVLGSLPLTPICHNDLMLPSEANLMLSKGPLNHSPAIAGHG